MRLINTRNLQLEEFHGSQIPRYVALSHSWEVGEVTFQEWQIPAVAETLPGYRKVESACAMARKHDIDYVWADTCCIDKSSSAELSEAINSMFRWYQASEICYCYLIDVDKLKDLGSSRWFTRGWTLQELLAPTECIFFNRHWSEFGTKESLSTEISEVTGIDEPYLTREKSLFEASIAKRMSWSSSRFTTRVEDRAYSMLGIFDVNIPLLYGEGPKAFQRLQEEIIRVSIDQTLFCWELLDPTPSPWCSMLAPSPEAFKHSGTYVTCHGTGVDRKITAYSMTNAGVQIQLETIRAWSFDFAVLNARQESEACSYRSCIPLQDPNNTGIMTRIFFMRRLISLLANWSSPESPMFIQSNNNMATLSPSDELPCPMPKYGFLLIFEWTDAKVVTWPENVFDTKTSILSLDSVQLSVDGVAAAIARFSWTSGQVIMVYLAIRRGERSNNAIPFLYILPAEYRTCYKTFISSLLEKLKRETLQWRPTQTLHESPDFLIHLDWDAALTWMGGLFVLKIGPHS